MGSTLLSMPMILVAVGLALHPALKSPPPAGVAEA
jgi:hypothetical protein